MSAELLLQAVVGPFRIKIESFECSKSCLSQVEFENECSWLQLQLTFREQIDCEMDNLYIQAQLMEQVF